MIYGKVEARVQTARGGIHLTVCDPMCSIKELDGSLIRLTRAELRELATDALSALDQLEAGGAA